MTCFNHHQSWPTSLHNESSLLLWMLFTHNYHNHPAFIEHQISSLSLAQCGDDVKFYITALITATDDSTTDNDYLITYIFQQPSLCAAPCSKRQYRNGTLAILKQKHSFMHAHNRAYVLSTTKPHLIFYC